jgi:hypothetical protein
VAVLAETALIASVLGVAMGLIWWWVAPTEQWTVVEGGLAPADPGFGAWFSADGWFLVLGVVAGVGLAAASWRRGRSRPVVLTVGIIVGAALVSLGAWALGGALGAPDPETAARTASVGTVVEGSLGIRAMGVLFAPALAALTVQALLLSSAKLSEEPAVLTDDSWAPQQSW